MQARAEEFNEQGFEIGRNRFSRAATELARTSALFGAASAALCSVLEDALYDDDLCARIGLTPDLLAHWFPARSTICIPFAAVKSAYEFTKKGSAWAKVIELQYGK